MLKLEKPVNKIGFTIFVIGFLGVLCSLGWWSSDGGYRDYWASTFNLSRRAAYEWQTLGRFSMLAVATGAILTWAYEPTVGRWIAWVWKKT